MKITFIFFVFLQQVFCKQYLVETADKNRRSNSHKRDGDMFSPLPPPPEVIDQRTCWHDGKFRDVDQFDEEKDEFVTVWKDCGDGFCTKPTEKCDGKCGGWQCESADGTCQDAGINTKWQNCKGKCIPKEDLCAGRCIEDYTCELNRKCLEIGNSEFEPIWQDCQGSCTNLTEKCDGKCKEGQCESEDGSCRSFGYETSEQICNGKCIKVDSPCDGECLGYRQCLLNGRCHEIVGDEYVDVWKSCDGACINITKKCHGICETYQCESKDGSCVNAEWHHGSPWKRCNGKCIKVDELCEGKCNEKDYLCERKGKCVRMFDEEEQIWKNCNGKCMKPQELCDGKCDGDFCEHKGKCLEMYAANSDQLWKYCNGKCIELTSKCNGKCDNDQCEKDGKCKNVGEQYEKCNEKCIRKSETCNGKCRDYQCESSSGKCKELVKNYPILQHGHCKGKCTNIGANNSTKSCEGSCTTIPGFKHILNDGRCFYKERRDKRLGG